VYIRHVTPKRRHTWVGFALFALLAILGLFVLGGVAAGVALFVAMLVFIFACIYALREQKADAPDKTGLTGWFGHWF
jgi:hypothetical protein